MFFSKKDPNDLYLEELINAAFHKNICPANVYIDSRGNIWSKIISKYSQYGAYTLVAQMYEQKSRCTYEIRKDFCEYSGIYMYKITLIKIDD